MMGLVCLLLFSFTDSSSDNMENIQSKWKKWKPCPMLVITNNSTQNPLTMGNYIINSIVVNGINYPVDLEPGQSSDPLFDNSAYMNVTVNFIGDGDEAIATGDYSGFECFGDLQRLVCTRNHVFNSGTEASHNFGCQDTRD